MMRLILKNPELMTNRELHTEFERIGLKNRDERRRLATEMAKRLNRLKDFLWMPNEENIQIVVAEFKHWKLNGAGDALH